MALPNEGTRIEAISFKVSPGSPIDDNKTVPPGTRGTVIGGYESAYDRMSQIWMRWDNGSTIALLPGEDRYRIITNEEENDG